MNTVEVTSSRSAVPAAVPVASMATPPPAERVRGLTRRINEVRTAIDSVNEDILEIQRHATDGSVDMTAGLNHVRLARSLVGGRRSDRYIEDAWRHVHDARRHVVRYSSAADLAAKAIELRQEAASGKLSQWRQSAVTQLLAKYDEVIQADSSVPSARVLPSATAATMIVKACEIRDEALANNYRKVTITNSYTRLLLISLGIIGTPFLVMLTLHARELSNSSSLCVTPPGGNTDISLVCRDELLARPWLVVLSVLAGGMGAIASALQRSSRDRANANIPELVGLGVASLSRIAVGFIAGLTLYLAIRSGALDSPKLQVTAVMLLAAFTFGFTERIFILGEKTKAPAYSSQKDGSARS